MPENIRKMFQRTNRPSSLVVKCSLSFPPSRSRISSDNLTKSRNSDVLVKSSPNPTLGGSHAPSRKEKQFYHNPNHPAQMSSGVFTHFS